MTLRVYQTNQTRFDAEPAVASTHAWLERVVIGLGLCPFAKRVFERRQIRYAVSDAQTPQALLTDLIDELLYLHATGPDTVETTLLIHPDALTQFLDHNDFLDLADAALAEYDLQGEIQVVGFHPSYRFADAAPDDMGNYSHRSPYPTLHLLREASVERALAKTPDLDAAELSRRNSATLRQLGPAGWNALQTKR